VVEIASLCTACREQQEPAEINALVTDDVFRYSERQQLPFGNEQDFWLAHKVKQEVDPAWTDPRVTTKAARASVVGTHPHQE
jgi:hypothetical protein